MTSERYHALIRGDARGPAAWAARAALWWARLPYGTVVAARNRLFDAGWKRSARAAVPAVCVGNLTLGGTGKTPMVEWVAGVFRESDRRVAILSRGYGADHGPNDEAMVLEENLPDVPHLQGIDRAALATVAVEELEAEVLVLDDGFQHRRLARDLDLVLIDATRPLAGDYLFPRGTLRESIRGLNRAGAIILTRVDQARPEAVASQHAWLTARFPNLPIATAVHAPVELVGLNESASVDLLQGKTVGLLSGLGNPTAFRRTVTDLGASIVSMREFPDHHAYTRADVDALRLWAGTLPADAVVATTQKDFVKLRLADLAGRPVWAVRIGMVFPTGEAMLREKLAAILPPIAEA